MSRSTQYFRACILAPLRAFIHERSPEEAAEIMLMVRNQWREPYQPDRLELNLDEKRPLSLTADQRGILLAEETSIEGNGTIERVYCRYESCRWPAAEKNERYRLSWNSPHNKDASNTYDPNNHHTFWHQHVGAEKPTEISDRHPSSNKDLLREYLAWLSQHLAHPNSPISREG